MESNSQYDLRPKPPLRCVGYEEWIVTLLRISICVAFVLLSAASRAGWLVEVDSLSAGPSPAPPDLSARYVFGWSGIEAAEAEVTLRRGPNGIFTGMVKGGNQRRGAHALQNRC